MTTAVVAVLALLTGLCIGYWVATDRRKKHAPSTPPKPQQPSYYIPGVEYHIDVLAMVSAALPKFTDNHRWELIVDPNICEHGQLTVNLIDMSTGLVKNSFTRKINQRYGTPFSALNGCGRDYAKRRIHDEFVRPLLRDIKAAVKDMPNMVKPDNVYRIA